MNYQNFDLEIICSQGDESLHARVLESPQGDSPFIDVAWPFETDEENEFLSEIYGGLRQRRARSTNMNSIQDFGGRLFDAVFTGDIKHLFRASLDAANRAGNGLRIRLRLPDDSALHSRPWEFLFDTESREFLAVREHTPLVRYLPVAQPIPPITVEGPLRILVALAAPTDHPPARRGTRMGNTDERAGSARGRRPSRTQACAGSLHLQQSARFAASFWGTHFPFHRTRHTGCARARAGSACGCGSTSV